MPKKKSKFDGLVSIVRKLRGPKGCPWDKVQTHETLKPYMVEEVYEAIEAIDSKDYRKLAEELGDILLHIVMHAEMAKEKNKFKIDDIISSISAKMIRRHPHVFSKRKVKSIDEVWQKWEEIKKREVVKKGEKHKGILESIPQSLPALYRADKVQRRAARVGFDWDTVAHAWEKVYEEEEEIHHLIDKFQITNSKSQTKSKLQITNINKRRLREEIGDLLFAVVNVTRKLNIDAEEALQQSTSKFMRRFKQIEVMAREQKKDIKKMTLEEMDKLWDKVKKAER